LVIAYICDALLTEAYYTTAAYLYAVVRTEFALLHVIHYVNVASWKLGWWKIGCQPNSSFTDTKNKSLHISSVEIKQNPVDSIAD